MSRTRIAIAAATAIAALGITASAEAAPTTPTLKAPPGFAKGDPQPSWTPATFDALSRFREYVLEVRDITTNQTTYPATTATSKVLTTTVDGHAYQVRVRAKDNPCVLANLAGTACLVDGPQPVYGGYSAPIDFRTDRTVPTAGIEVDGNAAFTRSREVRLTLTGDDPSSAGGPASGIGTVQLSSDGVFNCVSLDTSGNPECPVPFAAAKPYTLPDGPDGARTVSAQTRDRAVAFGPGPNTQLVGNASNPASDQIVLDRAAPTAVATLSSRTTSPGQPITFSALQSADATSGVDLPATSWQFGDGTQATGADVSKTYTSAGTYVGALTVRDRAGNASTTTFTVKVAKRAAAVRKISRVTRVGSSVAFKTIRVRVGLRGRTSVQATLVRTSTGAVVRRIGKTGGPGALTLSFKAPKAGRYELRVRSGRELRVLSLQVRAR